MKRVHSLRRVLSQGCLGMFTVVDYSVLRFGRRIPYCTFMLLGGVAGLLVLAVPDQPGQ